MTEIEILNNSQLGFIQNAIYTVAMVISTFIAFRVARVANEKNANILGKSLVTLYGIMVTFFLIQVSSYLSMQQKGLAYSLSELKATGVKLSAGSEAAISRYQINLSDGYPALAPELPNILFAAVVFLIIVGTTWLKNTSEKS
jgi:hypothetical protein